MREVLGVDVGGVITQGARKDADTFFRGDYLQTPLVPYVFESLHRIVAERFGEDVHIVSKCGPAVQEKTLELFKHHDFYMRTGISPANVHFCLERWQKVGICKEQGITHFVDDKLEVLGYLHEAGIQDLYLFRPDQREVSRFQKYHPHVNEMDDWRELAQRLIHPV
jgi:hypothetical protein